MVAITLQVCFSNDEQLYVCKVLFQGTQKSRNHKRWLSASTEWRYYWWGNLHGIGCTSAFFLLSDSHFGSGPIRDVKRTAGELKGIGVVWLWKVPLVKQVFTSYWLHPTDGWRRRKGEEERPLDRWSWPTDRQTCHADLYYFCPLRKRERWEQENLCWGDRCLSFSTPSPPSLRHLRQ